MKDLYVERRRRLTSLVHLDGNFSLNIATVIAVRSSFLIGEVNGHGKPFYDEELPAPTFCCFFWGFLFINTLNLVVQI